MPHLGDRFARHIYITRPAKITFFTRASVRLGNGSIANLIFRPACTDLDKWPCKFMPKYDRGIIRKFILLYMNVCTTNTGRFNPNENFICLGD